MKFKTIPILFIAGLLFFTAACGLFSDVTTTGLLVTLTREFPVVADSSVSGSDTVFAEQEIDALDNKDFASNRSKILEVEFQKLEYMVKDLKEGTGDSLIHGKFEFFHPGDQKFYLLAADSNRKFRNGLNFQINADPLAASKLSGLFKNGSSSGSKVKFLFTCRMNKRPLNFIIAPKIFLNLKNKL
jgi:hypothetical protein